MAWLQPATVLQSGCTCVQPDSEPKPGKSITLRPAPSPSNSESLNQLCISESLVGLPSQQQSTSPIPRVMQVQGGRGVKTEQQAQREGTDIGRLKATILYCVVVHCSVLVCHHMQSGAIVFTRLELCAS